MNVRLAVQKLIVNVTEILSNFGPADASGTAKSCLIMDKFISISNECQLMTVSSRVLKPFYVTI